MKSDRIDIITEDGKKEIAQAPIIVSASRSTDIPAFYAAWFFSRLEKGYSSWINPFNGTKHYIAFANTRLIVFWSKNPQSLLTYLPILKTKGINCYIQYTINNYDLEKLESNVPPLAERIETFKQLVGVLGFGRVIWRFDPMLLTDRIDCDLLLERAKSIGDQLKGYCEKMVFSFADIKTYKKVQSNLAKSKINYREFTEKDMNYVAAKLAELNKGWGYQLATCAENIDLDKYGIQHNKCIDDELMVRYFSNDKILMDHIGAEPSHPNLFDQTPHYRLKNSKKDKGQRMQCGCIKSKDIGEYNTCPHLCEYCYANASKDLALANYKSHLLTPCSENINNR